MRPLLCLACLVLFQVEEARTETATFQFSGRISYVGSTTEFPDLAYTFELGRPYTVSYTFDLETPDSVEAPSSGLYVGAITAATFNYNNSAYVGVMDPATMGGTIRMALGSDADYYTGIFGRGEGIIPTFHGDMTTAAFPPVGTFSFRSVGVYLTGFPTFLPDDALHPTLDFDANVRGPLSFTMISFEKVLGPNTTATMAIDGTVDSFQVLRETNDVPRVYLNKVSSLRLTNFFPARIAVQGTRAFILGYDEMRVVDLPDRRHPRQVSRYINPGSPGGIQATSNHVFVALSHQVQILENRNTPRLLGTFSDNTSDFGEIEVIDNFAYFVRHDFFGQSGNLKILDISDPLAPRLVATWTAPHGAAYSLAVVDNVAYVTSGRYVELLDVSNPAQPRPINAILTPNPVNDVAVSGNYAYIAVHTNGVQIVDVSNPALPQTVAAIRLANATSLAVADNYLLVADYFAGLRLFDVSRPENPVLLDTFPRSEVVDVRVVGDTIYLSNYSAYHEQQMSLSHLTLLQLASTARPRISIPHFTVAEDSGQHQFSIFVDDPDTPLDALTIEVDSDSPVITQPRLVSREGVSNVISFRTRADRHGTAPFAIRVTEPDGHSVRESSHLHVFPVDDTPPAVISVSSPSFVQVARDHFRVTAFAPGVANVTLQANGPTDMDGDRLRYLWYGSVPFSPISFERTLKRRLPIGTYYFSALVTDDGFDYSVADARIDVVPAHPQFRIPHRSGLISRPIAKGRSPFRPPASPSHSFSRPFRR
jgi:hypothetical protein